MSDNNTRPALRSRAWFNNPSKPDLTALYVERYLNFGLSLEELQSDRPIIGIAQTGSDLVPCNRHHLVLAERIKEGIREAGGIPLEFPVHPLQETGKRPTAMLDRNLAYLSLVEVLFGYPLDGVVLTIGCDKTTPACLMAAATVNIPAIALSVGPMLNGWYQGKRAGSGTIVWKAREMLAAGDIDQKGFVEMVASSAPSTGFCNTMGTRDHHEFADRDDGHVAAGVGRHSRTLPRPSAVRLADRPADRGDGAGRPQALGHPVPRCLHQRHPPELGAGRLDQCADSSHRHRPARRCGTHPG